MANHLLPTDAGINRALARAKSGRAVGLSKRTATPVGRPFAVARQTAGQQAARPTATHLAQSAYRATDMPPKNVPAVANRPSCHRLVAADPFTAQQGCRNSSGG